MKNTTATQRRRKQRRTVNKKRQIEMRSRSFAFLPTIRTTIHQQSPSPTNTIIIPNKKYDPRKKI